VFTEKKKKPGAKRAANELGVCLASFYNYADGKNLPRMEVLRAAQEKWKIKWDLLDATAITRKVEVRSPQQYALQFIGSMREKDVEISEIGPEKGGVLRVMLKIHLPIDFPSKVTKR
jgi:hypothetical protein